MSTGNSHAFDDKLYCKQDGRVVTTRIMNPECYLSAGSIDKTTNTISDISAMSAFKARFPFMESYTIEMILPGQAGTMQLQKGLDFLLWGAELKPTFFDAELLTSTHLISFNHRFEMPGMVHSGDLTAHNHFMHSVSCEAFNPDVYAAAAVGYQYNELIKYEAVSPFILLVDHTPEKKIMYAVPFSLEYATIGNSMMIAPLIFHMDGNGLVRWYVPHSCPTDARVATGEYTLNFKAKMHQIKKNFERAYRACVAVDTAVAPFPGAIPRAPAATSTAAKSTARPQEFVFVQDGVTDIVALDAPGRFYVNFGVTMNVSSSFQPVDLASPVVLPIVPGTAHGHAALALAKRAASTFYVGSSDEWRSLVDQCSTIIVHAKDGPEWYEGVMQAQTYRLGGLMIVHISQNLHASDVKARAIQMSDLKLCCVRMMSGLSVVVVKTPDGSAYFYRGAASILPVAPPSPQFAEAIDLDSTISLHRGRAAPLPLGSFVSQAFKMVLLHDGRTVNSTDASAFTDLIMKGGMQWDSALAQLSANLSNAEVDKLKVDLNSAVLEMEKAATKEMTVHLQTLVKALQTSFAQAPPDCDVTVHTNTARQAILDHKRTIRNTQAVYRDALGRVAQICSLKIVSARRVGVQQAQRKMAVQQNVARASNLTADQLAAKLIDCTWGFAVARIDPNAAMEMLNAISKSGMDGYLQNIATPMQVICDERAFSRLDLHDALVKRSPGFLVANNCTMLDSESVQILLNLKQTDHLLTPKGGKQLTFVMQGRGHLVLPLYNDYNALNGEYVDFMNKSNDAHVADYRVTLRGLLSNLKERYPIKASSPDLTFGIMMIVLSLMHSITASIPDPRTLDPECTVCQTLRGLMYLWGTFAGSGQKPVTFAFQLTQPGAKIVQPKLKGEWTIYALVAHIYPYTRLPLDAFKSNVRILLVHAFYRALILPIVEAANTASKMSADAAREKHVDDCNICLRWTYAACAILTRIDQGTLSKEDGVVAAQNLLHVAPQTAMTYTSRHLIKTLTLLVKGAPVLWDFVRILVACATIKRSGCFAQHKKQKTIGALTRAKVKLFHHINLKLPEDIITRVDRGDETDEKLRFCGKITSADGDTFVFKDISKTSSLPVQNESAYVNSDQAKMKGDAELVRKPWRIADVPISDSVSNADFLRKMLPSIAIAVSPPVAELLVDKIPKHCKNDGRLTQLWDSADVLHPSALNKIMPPSCMRTLFAAIGVSADAQPKAIGTVLHILMTDLKHLEKSEHAAIQHLKAAYDQPAASVELV